MAGSWRRVGWVVPVRPSTVCWLMLLDVSLGIFDGCRSFRPGCGAGCVSQNMQWSRLGKTSGRLVILSCHVYRCRLEKYSTYMPPDAYSGEIARAYPSSHERGAKHRHRRLRSNVTIGSCRSSTMPLSFGVVGRGAMRPDALIIEASV